MNFIYIFFVILLWISLFGIINTIIKTIKNINKQLLIYFIIGIISYIYLSLNNYNII
jgi:uncharacterized membrane protein